MDNNDILVFPSYSEGFPNVIVEALSQGMPIITTDVGGISDSALHNQNAYIVPVRNSKALKKSMEKFVQNKDLIENFSKNSCKIFLKNHQNENCRKIFNNF
jgi:glycosyltransferase involved in cell wall biosynthesis